MSIIATNEQKNITPAPAGTHVARCFSMVHIGTIPETIKGISKEMNKVRISWELSNEKKVFKEENGEQPFVLSKEFTLSMNEKANLRKFLESWRGQKFTEEQAASFDISVLIGKPCMVTVVHNISKASGKTYAEIAAVTSMPKGMDAPEQINPSFEFSVDNFDQQKFDSLPDFLKDKIKSSKEYKEMNHPNVVEIGNMPEDDGNSVPF